MTHDVQAEELKLVFTIDRDISPSRLEEYKRALNDLIGYEAKWEVASISPPIDAGWKLSDEQIAELERREAALRDDIAKVHNVWTEAEEQIAELERAHSSCAGIKHSLQFDLAYSQARRKDVESALSSAQETIRAIGERCAKVADDFDIGDSTLWSPGSEMNAFHHGQEYAANIIADRIRAALTLAAKQEPTDG